MIASESYLQALKKVVDTTSVPVFRHVIYSSEYISGMIFAIAACPELPMPNHWLPLVFKSPPERAKEFEINQLFDDLMSLFKVQLLDIQCSKIGLPAKCGSNDNESSDTSIAQWCKGFVFAHSNNQSCWQRAWDIKSSDSELSKVYSKDLSRILKLTSTLADFTFALEQRQEPQRKALLDNKISLHKSLIPCLKEYLVIAEELSKVLPENIELQGRADNE